MNYWTHAFLWSTVLYLVASLVLYLYFLFGRKEKLKGLCNLGYDMGFRGAAVSFVLFLFCYLKGV